jgi:succinate dehydrogenase / fumarate reductase, cytochrome b subunit
VGETQSLWDRHYGLFRRLHSLTGIVPVGVFLMFHLTTNGSIFWGLADTRQAHLGDAGVATFQHEVNFIHSIPFLYLMEIFGIWLPLAYHSAFGVVYAMTGRPNVASYPYGGNRRYVLQRVTGYVGILFIFWHIATLRWNWTWLLPVNWNLPSGAEPMRWEGDHAASSMAAIMQQGYQGMMTWGVVVTVLYCIGVAALVFHLANGLWTAAITWGLTVSDASQKRWGRVCTGLGVALMVLGLGSAIRFATLDYKKAKNTEIQLRSGHGAEVSVPRQSFELFPHA